MRKFAEAYPDFEIVQTVSAQLSWSHHTLILDKFEDRKLRFWYILKSVEQGWSYRYLSNQIKLSAHKKYGKLPNNFDDFLAKPQSDLAKEVFKDEYIFDFIAQSEAQEEVALESALTKYITDFLLALGKGFAFVGRQYHLQVSDQDFYIDMLFYHVRLHCYIVVELKTGAFKPEYAGKLNFYLSAVDSVVKQKEDHPTIGLLLCEYKNDLIVEFALRDLNKPMGVAAYQLTKQLPEKMKDNLPTEQEMKMIFKEIKKRTQGKSK